MVVKVPFRKKAYIRHHTEARALKPEPAPLSPSRGSRLTVPLADSETAMQLQLLPAPVVGRHCPIKPPATATNGRFLSNCQCQWVVFNLHVVVRHVIVVDRPR